MRIVQYLALATAIGALSSGAAAQQTYAKPVSVSPEDYVVKTVPLHHLTSAEAVQLLSPYVQSMRGGVFPVSTNIRAVTIREVPKTYAEMMTVLAQYDREPATLTLNFQLIAAENSSIRDPNLAGLDSLLRGILKYSGYKLLNSAVASASESGHVSTALSADGSALTLSVDVADLRVEPAAADGARSTTGGDASVHLNVSLYRDGVPARGSMPGHGPSQILSTGVTVPIGQTIVLGTSVIDGGQRALILTVRPQLAAKR